MQFDSNSAVAASSRGRALVEILDDGAVRICPVADSDGEAARIIAAIREAFAGERSVD